LPFRVGSNHFIPGGGPKKNGLFIECNFGEDCVTCAYSNPAAYGLTNVKQSPNLSKCKSRNYYAASGHIEEFFHLVEYYKDNENQEAGTFHQREKCEGKGCSFCKDKIPKVFGKRMYWEVSPSQWRHAIHDLHKKIQNSHCKCGGTIFVTSFGCSGCQKVVVDVSTSCEGCGSNEVGIDVEKKEAQCGKCGASWSAIYTDHEAIYKASNEPYKCRCGTNKALVPNRMCSTEG